MNNNSTENHQKTISMSKSFKNLKTLVEVFYTYRVKNLDVLANPGKADTLVDQLFNDILKGEVESLKDIQSKYKDHKGKMAKLKQRLLKSIVFIDQRKNQYSPYGKAYYESNEKLFIINTLLGENAIAPAISICKSTLKMAKEFELTDLIFELSKILKNHYSTREDDEKKYAEYKNDALQYLAIIKAEYELKDIYETLTQPYLKSSLVNKNALEYEAQIDKLERLARTYNTKSLYDFFYRIKVHIYLSKLDFEKIITTCQEAKRLLKEGKWYRLASILWFEVNMLNAFIITKKYKEGRKAIEDSLSFVKEYTNNWLTLLDLYFKLALHSKEYDEAYFLLRRAKKQLSKKKNMPENWRMNNLYIQYLIKIGKLESKETKDEWLKLENNFLKKVPPFSEDKRNKNINILILQILFLLTKGNRKLDKEDCLKALARYEVDRLQKNKDYRINCFVKMLLQLSEGDYNSKRVARYASTYVEKLKAFPLEKVAHRIQDERIPYEDLWEMILVQLEERFGLN